MNTWEEDMRASFLVKPVCGTLFTLNSYLGWTKYWLLAVHPPKHLKPTVCHWPLGTSELRC